tara:strand:- start:137 stop:709 length:573 start_codon:yes stop_codon:yes gene_type:complete
MTVPPQIYREMQEVGQDLFSLGLVSSHGGNLSVREAPNIWITGTGTKLGHLTSNDVSFVRPDGTYDLPVPSTDTLLHNTTYAVAESSVTAIVHAHPHHAIALSLELEKDFFIPEDYEGLFHLREVPLIDANSGYEQKIATELRDFPVVILRGHGAYARGVSLYEALHWITALEESAHISWLRKMIRTTYH